MFNNLTVKTVKENLGRLAKVLRIRQGFTQQHLADELKLSRLTIQNLESGKNPTIETLLIVLQHFDQLEAFNKYVESEIENNNYESLY